MSQVDFHFLVKSSRQTSECSVERHLHVSIHQETLEQYNMLSSVLNAG